MKFAFIAAEKARQSPISVETLCASLRVKRSTYYDWLQRRQRPPSVRERSNEALAEKVADIHRASRNCYGRPRIERVLRREGVRVGANRLRRIMVQNGIYGRKRRRVRKYGVEATEPACADLVQRDFAPKGRDQAWCGDITQIRVDNRWLYIATVIDMFSRRVVGLALGHDATTDLTVRAMLDALKRRRPRDGLVFHTDRGVQYRARRFRRLTTRRGVIQSMSRSGNCLDNAVAESFFATLEAELFSRRTWDSVAQAEREIRNYIFTFYNRQRIHSWTDYLSPEDFEHQRAA